MARFTDIFKSKKKKDTSWDDKSAKESVRPNDKKVRDTSWDDKSAKESGRPNYQTERSTVKSLVLASIDFGTTYSGTAFAFKHELERDPMKIYAHNQPGAKQVSFKAFQLMKQTIHVCRLRTCVPLSISESRYSRTAETTVDMENYS